LIGLLAAALTAIIFRLQLLGMNLPLVLILGVAAVAALFKMLFIRGQTDGRYYEGLTDLFVRIHTSSIIDHPREWVVRSVTSLLLALAHGVAGLEGAVMELAYAMGAGTRKRVERWFEQRRRTDAACTLAAGISAAFGAPFAAVLVPMEMGIGGRSLLPVLSSLFAFLGVSLLKVWFPVRGFDLSGALYGFGLFEWKEWLGALVIAVVASLTGVLFVRLTRYFSQGFSALSQGARWARALLGGAVLFGIAVSYKAGAVPSSLLLEDVLWSRKIPAEVPLAFFARFFSLSVLLTAFGTLGIFWPLFTLGGLLGFGIYELGFQNLSAFAAAAGLIGGAALWSSVLKTPIAAAVLVFEMTQNIQLFVPCLLAGLISRQLSEMVGGRGLVDAGLESFGLSLVGGRSLKVLEAIQVKDAVVSDHELIYEHEPVSELRGKLIKSRYPYLAVINRRGLYEGVLTLDMVREVWFTDSTVTSSHSSLSKLLEVKDLLYRSGLSVPTVKESQKVSEIIALMDQFACLPVLDVEGRLTGLLLPQNVRQAYDREVIRRSLELVAPGAGQ
jgi:CIC family chloride channel protein